MKNVFDFLSPLNTIIIFVITIIMAMTVLWGWINDTADFLVFMLPEAIVLLVFIKISINKSNRSIDIKK